jgi:hypothetical protein
LHDLQQYQTLIYGVLMISFILWLPNGLLSLTLRRHEAQGDEEVVEPAVDPGDGKRGSPT